LARSNGEKRCVALWNWNFARGDKKMKPSTENEIAGQVHEVKGKIKEKIGKVTNDADLEDEGTAEKVDGKIQKKVGQLEKIVGS
jgi:uncharacterized protein YjbJ (UPF0337 family)